MAADSQQHPLKIYFWIWGLLFLFSAFSYATDFIPKDGNVGLMRAGLILLFMFLKAGFIIAIFMHMAWERAALIWAICGPPVLLLFLIGFMVSEGGYTEDTRVESFTAPPEPVGLEHH
jgi:cytochrome c oxidase subunit 4